MDPHNSKLLAAVVPAFDTGSASTTGDVGLNRALISDMDSKFVRAYTHYGAGEFMPNDSRICVDWVTAGKSMKVAPADAHLLHPEQSFSRSWFWYGNVAL